MRGVVVGRFQPLHNGHAALIKQAIEDCVDVVVAIGSSQAKPSPTNPFSLEERTAMIQAAFPGVTVVAVPDIHDPPNWVDHMLRLTGPVDRAFGNDDQTMDLFEDAGIPVRRPGLEKREAWEGKTVRLQIAEGDGAWRKSVPGPVKDLLDSWDAGIRLRRLEAAL
ncbi:MAG: adenylyltransferase/cytidyltransferase family protein [Thermoplasmatota archaeon]